MAYTTLIAAAELARHLDTPEWAIIDCRFDLQHTEQGRQHYRQAHIPGALYAHLNDELAGTPIPGTTGFHPLPAVDRLAWIFSQWGIDHSVQVITYDDWGGLLAARLWWMLRWLGHEAVAVLDGGWQAWQQAGLPTRSGQEDRPPRSFVPRPREGLTVSTADVEALRSDPQFRLFDSRPPQMYRGEVEAFGLPAGHIPGAVSCPVGHNLDEQGHVLPLEELRRRYQQVLGGVDASQATFYCVSGVTSAHNLLALQHAGLGEGRLYVGSWSEWTADPQRPIACLQEHGTG